MGQSCGHVSLVNTGDEASPVNSGQSVRGCGNVRASGCCVSDDAEFANFDDTDSGASCNSSRGTGFGVDRCLPSFCVTDVKVVIARALYPSLLPVAWKFRLYLHPLGVPGTRVSFITGLVVCC